jgi:multiple sugar transport system ATP-binding protein
VTAVFFRPREAYRCGPSLSQLHQRLGVTTVYVTHGQIEAMILGDRVCLLRDGRLQQVDTPQYLYEAPVNLFVAGFIGSPAMNFAIAGLIWNDGAVVTFADCELPILAGVLEAKPGLADYFGTKIILGVRPSDIEDASIAAASHGAMRVVAGVTEELGSAHGNLPVRSPGRICPSPHRTGKLLPAEENANDR